jgi:sulfoxide reductase heme-binding subunit YedZ
VNTVQRVRFIGKPAVFLACLVPALLVVGDAFNLTGQLSANPVEDILDRFGNWGLRFVMIALAVTPLRRLTGWPWFARFRRMLGLFAFFYVLMHFLVWLLLDRALAVDPAFRWAIVWEDIFERPFITVGFTALLLLTAMALTSTSAMRRRMGRRWNRLHYSVYAVGLLGVCHFWWQVKQDIAEPAIYAGVLAILLGARLWHYGRVKRRKP